MTFSFGDCELDVERRELRRGGEPAALEPQVFDLLVYLIRNCDRVATKEDLIESIWGGRIVSESTLTSRLNAARKAVGDNGAAQRVIRTIPRKGVRFVAEVREEGKIAAEHAATLPARTPLALPDKPSIAVLPFANLSSDPEQEYLADGITEDIITALSRWRWFFVIASNSSFTYKGRAVDVAQVGRELGVRYLLEGSVRKGRDTIRITAQLVDTANGAHLWAERFDGAAGDIFSLQDEVTRRIAAAIEPALARTESQQAARKPTENMFAWDCYLRGLWHFNQLSEDNRLQSLTYFERAVALDDELADAHIGIARVLHGNAIYSYGSECERNLARSAEAAQRALELDNDNAYAWYTLAMVAATSGDSASAVEAARKAVELNANLAWGHFALAVASLYHGETLDALSAIDAALRLNPNDPQRFAWLAPRASALYLLQRYDEAVETALQAQGLRRSRGLRAFTTASRVLAASYAKLGRTDEARAAVAEMLEDGGSERTIADVIRPFRKAADRDRYAEGLRMAGLPDA